MNTISNTQHPISNILVTGANGQLGSELRELSKILDSGYRGMDLENPKSQITNHKSQFRWYFTDWQDLDITDAEAVKSYVDQNNIDVIINAAAYTAVDKAESEPDIAGAINHYGAKNLAEAALMKDALLIHVSTDYVFDGTGCTPYREEMPASPLGVYGETKLRGEQAVQASGARAVIIRTAWLYSSFGQNFVKTMLRLGRERDTLSVVADQIGTPTYARDLALAIVRIINKDSGYRPGEKDLGYRGMDLENPKSQIPNPISNVSNPKSQIYHYTNEGVASWYDFAKAVMEMAGLGCEVQPIETREYPTPAKRPGYSVLNKTKIKQAYNLQIPYWRDALRECLNRILDSGGGI